MYISELKIRNIRCIREGLLGAGEGINLVVGENGAGKTTLLESIYFLGHGRSFKRTEFDKLVCHGEREISVFGKIVLEGKGATRIGIEKTKRGGRIRIDGNDVFTNKTLAEKVIIGAFFPGREALVWGSKRERRNLIDWVLFHVEPKFGELSSQYERGIRGRNTLLRTTHDRRTLASWSDGLAEIGIRIHEMRERVMAGFLKEMSQRVSGSLGREIVIGYRRGWSSEKELGDVWRDNLNRDERRGWTAAGPHAADLELKSEGFLCRDVLSRGQGKVLALEMFLAAVEFLRSSTGKRSVVLLDDIYSEVDANHLQAVLEAVAGLGHQVFLSSLEQRSAETLPGLRVFHVEQGIVSEVV